MDREKKDRHRDVGIKEINKKREKRGKRKSYIKE
jgi:hypothetical protein